MEQTYLIAGLFLIIAILYSSVGFGGGSSYLAILAIFEVSYLLMPKIALICNLVVVTGGTYIYLKNKKLSFSRAVPFVITSVPMAFLGGIIPVEKIIFLTILAIALFIAGFVMLIFNKTGQPELESDDNNFQNSIKKSWIYGLSVGSGLGFIAGMVGIGGGIFLAPILHLSKWGTSKQIAATATFFILVNSVSGLIGQYTKEPCHMSDLNILYFAIPALIGGQIGSRMSSKFLSEKVIKTMTAILVLFVSIRIIYKLTLS